MSNIAEVFQAMAKKEADTAARHSVKRIGQLKDVAEGRIKNAFLYTAHGDGEMRPIQYVRADWWAVTGKDSFFTASFCCCPDTPVYGKGE